MTIIKTKITAQLVIEQGELHIHVVRGSFLPLQIRVRVILHGGIVFIEKLIRALLLNDQFRRILGRHIPLIPV